MGGARRETARGWRPAVTRLVVVSLLVSAAAVLICPCPPPSVDGAHGCCPDTETVIAANDCCASAAHANAPSPVVAAPSAPAPATIALAVAASPVPVAVREAPLALTADSFFVASPPLVLRV